MFDLEKKKETGLKPWCDYFRMPLLGTGLARAALSVHNNPLPNLSDLSFQKSDRR